MVASVARQLRWACFHDRIVFAAAELMRLKVRRCGGKAQRQACREALFTILSLKNMVSKTQRMKIEHFKSSQKGEPYSKPVFQTQA